MFAFIHRSYLGGSEGTTDTTEKEHHRARMEKGDKEQEKENLRDRGVSTGVVWGNVGAGKRSAFLTSRIDGGNGGSSTHQKSAAEGYASKIKPNQQHI